MNATNVRTALRPVVVVCCGPVWTVSKRRLDGRVLALRHSRLDLTSSSRNRFRVANTPSRSLVYITVAGEQPNFGCRLLFNYRLPRVAPPIDVFPYCDRQRYVLL